VGCKRHAPTILPAGKSPTSGGCMGLRNSLDTYGEEKITCPTGFRNPGHPARGKTPYSLRCLSSCFTSDIGVMQRPHKFLAEDTGFNTEIYISSLQRRARCAVLTIRSYNTAVLCAPCLHICIQGKCKFKTLSS
jgi:hypothetical protein